MLEIIDYKILSATDVFSLSGLVLFSIQDGWQPFGGVSASLSESDEYQYTIFAQAMVKYGPKSVAIETGLVSDLIMLQELDDDEQS